jgi:hypothetical protein
MQGERILVKIDKQLTTEATFIVIRSSRDLLHTAVS